MRDRSSFGSLAYRAEKLRQHVFGHGLGFKFAVACGKLANRYPNSSFFAWLALATIPF